MSLDASYEQGGCEIAPMCLDEVEKAHAQAVEAHWQDQNHILRSRVIALLQRHEALGSDVGWVGYRFGTPDAEPSAFLGDEGLEVLVLLDNTTKEKPRQVPTIRVITNECIRMEWGINFYTEDVKIDDENDAFFFVDAAFSPDAPEERKPRTGSPLITYTEQGEVYVRNLDVHPPAVPVEAMFKEGQRKRKGIVWPFGAFANPHDRQYALGKINAYLDMVEGREPAFKHIPPPHPISHIYN